MKKTNGYYMGKYLKSNFFVLLCELVIVLLLSLICTIILEGEPMWLTPALATVAYLMAEIRFMMAYVATKARHEHELEQARLAADTADDEGTLQQALDMGEEDKNSPESSSTSEADEATEQEQDEETIGLQDDIPAEDIVFPEQEQEGMNLKLITVDMDMDGDDEQADSQAEQAFVLLDEEPEWQEATALSEDEKEKALNSIEDIDVDEMTMDEGDLATDTLEIGEIDEIDEPTDRYSHH